MKGNRPVGELTGHLAPIEPCKLRSATSFRAALPILTVREMVRVGGRERVGISDCRPRP